MRRHKTKFPGKSAERLPTCTLMECKVHSTVSLGLTTDLTVKITEEKEKQELYYKKA